MPRQKRVDPHAGQVGFDEKMKLMHATDCGNTKFERTDNESKSQREQSIIPTRVAEAALAFGSVINEWLRLLFAASIILDITSHTLHSGTYVVVDVPL